MADVRTLLEKSNLPPWERIAEQARRQAAIDRFLLIAPALEAAGISPMTDDEIQAEIVAVRAERRESGGADRP